MASYSYKEVACMIPEHIVQAFIKEHGEEPDWDPNYDGDQWVLAEMYITSLRDEVARLSRHSNERHIAVEALQQIRNSPRTSEETREAVVSVIEKMKEFGKNV